jgi:hypothetical protein
VLRCGTIKAMAMATPPSSGAGSASDDGAGRDAMTLGPGSHPHVGERYSYAYRGNAVHVEPTTLGDRSRRGCGRGTTRWSRFTYLAWPQD